MLDLVLIFTVIYCVGFVLYVFYGWWRDFKTVIPNPPKVYTTQVINFPDGVVTLTDKRITSPIPDISTWTEPMQELFLLIVKDWRNWEKLEINEFRHKPTGIRLEDMGYYSSLPYPVYYTSLGLEYEETSEIVYLAKVWKEVHYDDKLRRISRIKALRNERLAKELRQKEAQQIRNYLQENGL